MLSLRRAIAVVSLVFVGSVMQAEPAHAQRVCRGFGPRYGVPVARSCWYPGGWYGGWRAACLPRPCGWRTWGWAACPPWGGYAWPRVCSPRPWCGPWVGWPGCGVGGWYGGTTFFGYQSVSLTVPPGGGATFFSGAVVPFPVPYAVPYGVPYPVAVPWFGAAARPAAAAPPIIAAARPDPRLRHRDRPAGVSPPPPRPGLALARRRARQLVAEGDDLLRRAAGDPVRLQAAATAYRRAAAVASDDPDVHIRHAIVLAALGRQAESGQATRQATAIDGRLADRPTERAAGEATPLVARGTAILRTIAAVEDGPLPGPLAELATVWAGGRPRPLAAVASADGRATP